MTVSPTARCRGAELAGAAAERTARLEAEQAAAAAARECAAAVAAERQAVSLCQPILALAMNLSLAPSKESSSLRPVFI